MWQHMERASERAEEIWQILSGVDRTDGQPGAKRNGLQMYSRWRGAEGRKEGDKKAECLVKWRFERALRRRNSLTTRCGPHRIGFLLRPLERHKSKTMDGGAGRNPGSREGWNARVTTAQRTFQRREISIYGTHHSGRKPCLRAAPSSKKPAHCLWVDRLAAPYLHTTDGQVGPPRWLQKMKAFSTPPPSPQRSLPPLRRPTSIAARPDRVRQLRGGRAD